MTITDIAKAFSNGQFKDTYHRLADNIEWTVVEENIFVGKAAVIHNCEQVENYFKSVSTNFKILNVITDKDKIVINGTAEFLRDNKRLAFISSCDVYEFNEKQQLEKITSYCIQKK